jgi:hypothetical protein
MIFQPSHVVIEGAWVGGIVRVVAGEQNYVGVVVESLLLGTIQNGSWLRPVCHPKGIGIGRVCSGLLCKYPGSG